MLRPLLIFITLIGCFTTVAQKRQGSITFCITDADLYSYFQDSIFVSLEGKIKLQMTVKPDDKACVLLPKLAYGNYTLTLKARDFKKETVANILVKDTTPVLLNLKLRSSIILMEMSITGYFRKLVPTDSWNMARSREDIKSDEQGVNQYKTRAQKEKEEHIRMKNKTWVPVDSLYDPEIVDAASWKNFIIKKLPYPEDAIDMGIEGKTYLSFETDENGRMDTMELLRGNDHELAVPLMHALNKAPGITPPIDETGKPVRQKYILVVRFKLKEENDK